MMSDDVYHRLAKVLDTSPNGFPATDSGSASVADFVYQPAHQRPFSWYASHPQRL